MRGSPLICALILALIGTAACTESTPGQALPGPTRATSAGSGGPFPTGASRTTVAQQTVPPSPLRDIEPCSLLSAAEAAELRAGPGKSERLNNARACLFHDADGFSMSMAVYDELGLEDIVAHSAITPVPTVGKHNAVQWMGGIRTCAISLEVTKTSRVDAQGTNNQPNDQKSCEIALRVAKLIEPRLPQ